jgi:hypothetical protein
LTTAAKAKDAGVTLRAVLLSLILIPINNHWITVIEVRWYALDGTCLPLFITPVFVLFVLALANLGVRALFPRSALRRGELLTIYMMVVMGATLASHDLIQNLFGAIGHPHYMANDGNKYRDMFFRYLPDHLLVSDPIALKGFYRGNTDPWTWGIIRYWIEPLAWWAGLVIVLIGMMMCLNIIIRKAWTENEKLVFPLVQLPVEMAAEDAGPRFYANKLMWAGFAVAFAIGLINGLHSLYPSMPFIEGIKHYNLGALFNQRPWNAVQRGGNGFQIAAYPFTIGLAYFMPLDLSFSCWFFYVARKLVQVLGSAMGWDSGGSSQFPYYESQSSGAWLALGAIIISASMPYLRGIWRQAWHSEGAERDTADAKLYRGAFLGLIAGAGLLFLFTKWMGMAAWAAVVFFLIYFVIAIAITRVRAELGTPHEIYFVNPQQIMVSIFGYNVIGPMNLTMIATLYWFNRGYRSHPMPNQLESFKMAEGTSIRVKPLVFALMLATVVGLISSYYSNLSVTYNEGAQAKCLGFKWWVGAESFDRLRNWMIEKSGPDPVRLIYMAVGAGIVAGLGAMRGAFVGWPFHPAGYALAVSYAMDYFWFAIFVSWLAKLIIVRYGGMKLHNLLVPFFLGLVLGDFCIGSIWAIVGPVMGTQTYKIFI